MATLTGVWMDGQTDEPMDGWIDSFIHDLANG